MEKKEWGDQKSYTFRYQVTSNDRTLTKEDLINVANKYLNKNNSTTVILKKEEKDK